MKKKIRKNPIHIFEDLECLIQGIKDKGLWTRALLMDSWSLDSTLGSKTPKQLGLAWTTPSTLWVMPLESHSLNLC